MRPQCFEPVVLEPADEKAMRDLWERLREIVANLRPGSPVELVVSRSRGSNRLTGYITERHYPLEPEA